MAERHPGVSMLPEGAARWAFGFGAACYAAGLRPPDRWGCARDDGDLHAYWFAAASGRAMKDSALHVCVSYSVDDDVCMLFDDRADDNFDIVSFMVGRYFDEDASEWREGPALDDALARAKRFLETGRNTP